MTILIAGFGYLGSTLGSFLVREGHDVLALSRSVSDTVLDVAPCPADLLHPGSIQLPRPVDRVVYCPSAGGTHADAEARTVYTAGLANLAHVLKEQSHPVQRFVYVSSTGVFAETEGGWVEEHAPVNPARSSAAALLEGEHMLKELGLPSWTVARLSGLYGPGRQRLIEAVRAGKDTGVRKPQGLLNQVHIDDAALALRHLLFLDNPQSCYIVSDNLPSRREDVLTWIADRMNRPIPEPHQHPGAEAVQGKRCSNRRLLDSGYRFKYPDYRSGYESLICSL